MSLFYNRSEQKHFRRFLRNNSSKAEIILWFQLKNRKLGFKFRRQYGVGPYVVDFHYPQMRLAVEVDGEQHAEESYLVYDRQRQAYLEQQGLRVVRFSQEEVLNDIHDVVRRLKVTLTFPRSS